MLHCDEMLSLAGVSGGTDHGSETSWSRAVPGHTQQAHTREFYMLCQPRDLLYTSCRAVWEDGSHFSAYVHTKRSCTKQDTNPSHPLTRPDTFAFVIFSRSQTPNFFPFPLSSNSHSSLYPPPLHFSAFPPPVARIGG